MSGLTKPEIYSVVNDYIGVKDGYLGDFSYRTHREFYPYFCDLDIDPEDYGRTTGERFIQVLASSTSQVQAKILLGVLKKYPPTSSEQRERLAPALKAMIVRLEGGAQVIESGRPQVTSEVVERALADAETLLERGKATSAVDRVHTALHGYLNGRVRRRGALIRR